MSGDAPEQVPCRVHSWRSRADSVPGITASSAFRFSGVSGTAGRSLQRPAASARRPSALTPQYSPSCGHRPWRVRLLASKPSDGSLLHSVLVWWVWQKAGCQLRDRTYSREALLPGAGGEASQLLSVWPHDTATHRSLGLAEGSRIWKWVASALLAPSRR